MRFRSLLATITMAFVLVLGFGNKVNAQTTLSIREYIKSFDSQIAVHKDGTIEVTETINYDFGPNQRHGIFRTIPFIKTNAQGKKFRLTFSDIQVANYKFEVSYENSNVKIKIGDPDEYVKGVHTYLLKYKVAGALTYFSDHDELYWNVTGNDWQVPIAQAEMVVDFPKDFPLDTFKLDCYTGVVGSTERNCEMSNTIPASTQKPRVFAKVTGDLGPSEGLTASIGFPKDIVAVLEPKVYYWDTILFIIFSLLLLLSYGVIVWYYLKIYREWKNTKNKQKIVAAWFSPPKYTDGTEFSPAETAGIVDKSVNHKALTATIIHLAQRGYLKIVIQDKKNFSLIKKKEWADDSNVRDFEKTLLNSIFIYGTSEVTSKQLKNSTTFLSKLRTIYSEMIDSLYYQHMFYERPSVYPILIAVLLIFATVFSIAFGGIIFTIIGLIFLKHSIRKTDLGIEKYSEAKSLLNFLKSQEEQLDFQAHNQMFFEKLLPFATAFGVEKIWAERFKDLQFTQSDWYQANNGNMSFNSLAYISSLNSLSRGFSSMSSTSSSSGFSSGSGGSSGGGGGGGGGGSW